jgi:FkbM family methyltransferase
MNVLRRWWTSEDSRAALRVKQLISSSVPEPLLIAAKKRYYFRLLRDVGTSDGEREMHALPKIVERGDFVIDIGANIGVYTQKLASIVGEAGLVWSIEPVPQTFDILSYLIRKNGWTNVRPLNVAISDGCGFVQMEIPRWKGGGESWYDARIFSPETRHPRWRTVSAQATTLDSLSASIDRRVSFIKCDTEFHELACLRGACQTIAKWRPAWLIETLDDYYRKTSDADKIAQFLAAFGYKSYLFDGHDFHRSLPSEKNQNTFFLHDFPGI